MCHTLGALGALGLDIYAVGGAGQSLVDHSAILDPADAQYQHLVKSGVVYQLSHIVELEHGVGWYRQSLAKTSYHRRFEPSGAWNWAICRDVLPV